MEDVNKQQQIFLSLSLSKLECSPKKLNAREIHQHNCHFQQTLINAKKFEKMRDHFKSDVFTALAIAIVKPP